MCVVIFDVFGTRATKNIVCFNGTLMPICLYTGIYIFKWTVFSFEVWPTINYNKNPTT